MIDETDIISRSLNQVQSDLPEQTLMMSIAAGKYFAVQDTAQNIWHRLVSPIKVADLIDQIVSEFDITREACTADVLPFLCHLAANGLIEKQADGIV